MAAYKAVSQTSKRRPYGRWDRAQDARLTSLWASENLIEIGHRLQRTPDAVRRRAQRLGLVPFSPMDGCFSQAFLAGMYGVHHRKVATWAAEGLLVGSQHAVTRRWTFTYEQVMAFELHHHDVLPPRLRWVMRTYADAVEAAHERQQAARAAGKPSKRKAGAA